MLFNSVIPRFGNIPLPHRSPDLTMSDFFFELSQTKRLKGKTWTLEQLKTVVINQIEPVEDDMLITVNAQFENGCKVVSSKIYNI